MFMWMHRLLPRFGPRRLMLAALALAALRWLLIGHFAHQLPILLFAQTLHAFSFGVFHAASIHLIHQFFPRIAARAGSGVVQQFELWRGQRGRESGRRLFVAGTGASGHV